MRGGVLGTICLWSGVLTIFGSGAGYAVSNVGPADFDPSQFATRAELQHESSRIDLLYLGLAGCGLGVVGVGMKGQRGKGLPGGG